MSSYSTTCLSTRADQFIRDNVDDWISQSSHQEITDEEDDSNKFDTSLSCETWDKSRLFPRKRITHGQLKDKERSLKEYDVYIYCLKNSSLPEAINKLSQIQTPPVIVIHDDDEIDNAIEDAKWILELADDWDDEGSIGYPKELLSNVKSYLHRWINKSWRDFGKSIPMPNIQPGPDGTIDLHWKKETYELLLNIPSNNELIHFYGDDYNENVIKGSFPQDAEIPSFLFWLFSVN